MVKQRHLKTILVDDELLARVYLRGLLAEHPTIEVVAEAAHGFEAIEFVRSNAIDLALLDIEMPQMSGLELAEELHRIDPCIEIIFVTAFEQYALDAYRRHVLGYLVKPCEKDELSYYVAQAMHLKKKRRKHVLSIRTFGRFDAYSAGELLVFSNAKAKELLALLVDYQGGEVSMELACSVLWEDHPYGESEKALYRRATSDLRKLLQSLTDEDILLVSRGSVALNTALVNCDLYDYLKSGSPTFKGEYMAQYAWAEERIACLIWENESFHIF